MLVPNLAIHLTTADERKAFTVNAETHLQPVLCWSLGCVEAGSGEGKEGKEGEEKKEEEGRNEVQSDLRVRWSWNEC